MLSDIVSMLSVFLTCVVKARNKRIGGQSDVLNSLSGPPFLIWNIELLPWLLS